MLGGLKKWLGIIDPKTHAVKLVPGVYLCAPGQVCDICRREPCKWRI